jgi:hypothetical protein
MSPKGAPCAQLGVTLATRAWVDVVIAPDHPYDVELR